jgi:hypothetical protein
MRASAENMSDNHHKRFSYRTGRTPPITRGEPSTAATIVLAYISDGRRPPRYGHDHYRVNGVILSLLDPTAPGDAKTETEQLTPTIGITFRPPDSNDTDSEASGYGSSSS